MRLFTPSPFMFGNLLSFKESPHTIIKIRQKLNPPLP
jgi:hypothetical protein